MSMHKTSIAALLIGLLLSGSTPPTSAALAIDFGSNAPTPADDAAIRTLLASYTAAVTAGDEERFKRLLLNEQIPFAGVAATIQSDDNRPFNDRAFDDFDRSIFKSGVRFQQSFSNVRILQDGPLAQVSLDFVTMEAGSGQGGWGWKILQLVKVNGSWKIASEFYTGHPFPKS